MCGRARAGIDRAGHTGEPLGFLLFAKLREAEAVCARRQRRTWGDSESRGVGGIVAGRESIGSGWRSGSFFRREAGSGGRGGSKLGGRAASGDRGSRTGGGITTAIKLA